MARPSIACPPLLQAPLWDVAARGAGAFPNNTAFVHEFTTNLLTTSFPNMRPQQVQVTACVAVPVTSVLHHLL
jgi:exportin-1